MSRTLGSKDKKPRKRVLHLLGGASVVGGSTYGASRYLLPRNYLRNNSKLLYKTTQDYADTLLGRMNDPAEVKIAGTNPSDLAVAKLKILELKSTLAKDKKLFLKDARARLRSQPEFKAMRGKFRNRSILLAGGAALGTLGVMGTSNYLNNRKKQ